jgi:NlpC/P60 family putative phage cell wall peptidase
MRAEIITEARSWLGTPFHHQGRVKKAGCDCIGMVLGALHNAGAQSRMLDEAGQPIPFTEFDRTDYSIDPNSDRLKHTLDEHLIEIPLEELLAGDVLLFKVIHLPQHVGIVGDHPSGGLSLIHAYSPAGKVVEEVLAKGWLSRVVAAYRVPSECFKEVSNG